MDTRTSKSIITSSISLRRGIPVPQNLFPPRQLTTTKPSTNPLPSIKVTSAAARAEATGLYTVRPTFFMPEDFDSTLATLREQLATGEWDALVIGGGLKMTAPLTVQFEKVVNACREVSPRTRMLFQAAPGDLDEVVERGFKGET